jgi:lipoic acid synthetase
LKKPEWLAIKPASTERYAEVKRTISSLGLHTVCVEAHCPNAAECWDGGTATFMVLGDLCTRGCRFCSVLKSVRGRQVDAAEPEKLAAAISKWGLSYVVITSVCRDDLSDQGSSHFAECIRAIKRSNPNTLVELLIPDFRNDEECLQRIVDARPDVVGHNIETVRSLSRNVRDARASYDQSLGVLKRIKELDSRVYTKSAVMLGLGEGETEVLQAMDDLRAAAVDFIAIGQYLRPTERQIAVSEYIKPERFEYYKKKAQEKGFLYAAAGPFVRSSYRAGEHFIRAIVNKQDPSG